MMLDTRAALYGRFVANPDRAGIEVEILSAEYQTISDVDVIPCQLWKKTRTGR